MENDKIDRLLEKYWRAETTVEEERLIKTYLETHEVHKDFIEDEEWFAAIRDYKSIEHEQTRFKGDESKNKFKTLHSIWFKAAATLVVVSGLAWLGIGYQQQLQAENESAMRKTAEASLMTMSDALNEGYRHLNESTKLINKSNSQN